jgi:hypothetical protein
MAIPQLPHSATVTLITPGARPSIAAAEETSTPWSALLEAHSGGLAYFPSLCHACLEARQRCTYQ